MLLWTTSYPQPDGVNVSYWRLANVYIETSNKTGVCKAEGYLDQASYEAGKPYILTQDYVINFSAIDPGGAVLGAVLTLVQTAQSTRIKNEVGA